MLVPALFTRMSRRPSRRAASSTMARHASGSARSKLSETASSSRAATAFLAASRPATATAAPACASARAMARPMPPLPPVTSAAFPDRLKLFDKATDSTQPSLVPRRRRLDRPGGLGVDPLEILQVLPDLGVAQALVWHRDVVVLLEHRLCVGIGRQHFLRLLQPAREPCAAAPLADAGQVGAELAPFADRVAGEALALEGELAGDRIGVGRRRRRGHVVVLEVLRRRLGRGRDEADRSLDRKSTRLNSSHLGISYAVFC